MPKRDPRKAGAIEREIRKLIRVNMLAAGVSQQQLAHALGITFQQVQKYESGANRVAFSRIIAIARVLDAAVADFEQIFNPVAHIWLRHFPPRSLEPSRLDREVKSTPEHAL